MPFSSSALMRDASVYLAGGAVKCCSASSFSSFSGSPSVRFGSFTCFFFSSSSSSRLSSYTAVKPLNLMEEYVPLKI